MALDISYLFGFGFAMDCTFGMHMLKQHQATSVPRRQRKPFQSETLCDHNWNHFNSYLHSLSHNSALGAIFVNCVKPFTAAPLSLSIFFLFLWLFITAFLPLPS